jgi:hypothetical protein
VKDMTTKRIFKGIGIIIIFAMCFHVGCKKSETETVNPIYKTWQWVQSVGGIGGVLMTPATTGYNQTLELDESGLYRVYRDSTLLLSGNFSIISIVSELDNQSYEAISLDNGSSPLAIISVTDTDLVLRDECVDCFTHTYQSN